MKIANPDIPAGIAVKSIQLQDNTIIIESTRTQEITIRGQSTDTFSIMC